MSEADPTPEPKPAPRLGSYVLIKQLGSGGMSNVFRAVHEETGNMVAVKVLPRTLAKNLTLLERFIREAKSAEALDHPNIAAIYDRGFDQGRHYLVLEYVEGNDLHDRVRMNGPLQAAEAVRFIREVAEGLNYAASLKMIHRDVKPANLLMTPDGHAKIIDLGLALQTDDEDERVTRDGTTVGTVDYMAPEQARDSRQTSERSDIYSLGCTFYYLLTGSQPYPGGDLADKLSRHYKAPIPDIRATRPELAEDLSLLIRRMMEKKPDRRYADYTQLIAGLDALSDSTRAPSAPPVILDVLFADDDDDDDEIGLLPADPVPRNESSSKTPISPPVLMAEIVDDDDDEPAPARPPSRAEPPKRKPAAAPAPAEFSLADLAGLDSDEDLSSRRQGRRPSAASSIRPTVATPSFEAMLDEDDDEPVEGTTSGVRRGGDELSLKTWIAAGAMVGLAIAVVGFGVSMVISFAKPQPKPVEEITIRRPDVDAADEAPREPTPPKVGLTGPRAPTRPSVPVRAPVVIVPKAETPVVVVPEAPAEEVVYSKELETRLGPPPVPVDPSLGTRPRVVVRRAIEGGDEVQTPSLSLAFARAGDLVEIADTGPFFEDDFQVSGKSRLIRARAGIRPIFKVEPTSQPLLKEQDAKFVLGNGKVEQLTLEGIDLVVDLRDLPDRQTTLFLCRGAEIILRDCTITLVVPPDRKTSKFSVFRVEEGVRANKVILDRSTIRGPIRTLVDLTAARAEVVINRSIVISDTGPMILADAVEKPARSLYFHRSLIAARGPVLEFTGRPTPLVVRSLGSTFARIEGGTSSGLIQSKTNLTGDPRNGLDWSGEHNTFDGWPAWLTTGSEAAIKVSRLEGLRVVWPESDRSSRETSTPWPASVAREDILPADLNMLASDRRGTILKIASPHPRLREVTIDSINRLLTPELSTSMIPAMIERPMATAAAEPSPAAMPPKPRSTAVVSPPTKPTPRVVAKTQGGGATQARALDVTFDVTVSPWSGDLGRFLADTIVAGTTRATVRIRGEGIHPMSPVRLPDGLSIAIFGAANELLTTAIPTFIPKPEAAGRSMIELHGGDLTLVNLGFSTDGQIRPSHWVWSEDGLLVIKHCRFRDQGGSSMDVGAMIAFIAPGSEPMVPRNGPFESPLDRPTAKILDSVIWTGGDAVLAEVGRGVVDLENCLIISGGPAVSMLPGKVARNKFEADLILERCTIADDRTAIALGPWSGDPEGPDRPWLVSTRACVFPRTQVGATGSILLVDADAMARGVLFWQSFSDAYEVGRFLASNASQPASPPAVDLKKGWVDLWGPEHARSDRGPDFRRNEHVIRYKASERPRPGKVTPAILELDPKSQKDLGVDLKTVPIPKA